ncbi:hypothetical protein SAY87_030620 [Trapa incisa]|uniref:Uncharacterized protein n=1 Tax=Trapa incisa TaxID=236973 RepID=A0AAN7QM16_9MYRT|nr:hypothetical protein SAY87_030620 [Trapa incisa]
MKGVSYDYVEEDILKRSPILLELNPVHKTVSPPDGPRRQSNLGVVLDTEYMDDPRGQII